MGAWAVFGRHGLAKWKFLISAGEMEIFDLGDGELGCAGGQLEEMVNEVKVG
jgi:hypothetical protein